MVVAEPAASVTGGGSTGNDTWTEHVDTRSGRTYYVNKYTGESSWDKPADDGEEEKEEVWAVGLDEFGVPELDYDELHDHSVSTAKRNRNNRASERPANK